METDGTRSTLLSSRPVMGCAGQERREKTDSGDVRDDGSRELVLP